MSTRNFSSADRPRIPWAFPLVLGLAVGSCVGFVGGCLLGYTSGVRRGGTHPRPIIGATRDADTPTREYAKHIRVEAEILRRDSGISDFGSYDVSGIIYNDGPLMVLRPELELVFVDSTGHQVLRERLYAKTSAPAIAASGSIDFTASTIVRTHPRAVDVECHLVSYRLGKAK